MPTRIFTRLRLFLRILLLCATCVALLPAQSTSAEGQTVILSKPQLDLSLWNAHSDLLLSRSQRVEALIRTELLNVSNCSSEDLAELQRRYIASLDASLGGGSVNHNKRDTLSYQELAETMLNAASSMRVFQSDGRTDVIGQAWRDLSAVRSVYQGDLPTDYAEIAKGVRQYWPNVPLDPQDEVQQAAFQRAQADPVFAATYDKSIGQDLGVSIKDFGAATFLAAHPEFPIPTVIRDNIRPDGSVQISLDELKALATTEFGKVNASIDDLQKTLVTLDLQQTELADYMHNEQARRAAEAMAEAKAQEHQLKLQAADSAIFIISKLAGFIDPKVGSQIATVGQSAIQIGESLNGWMAAVAGLNTLDKITSLSTVVMTGNLLNAVINIVGLFGSGQPTPDQIILQEIGKLRQQVGELRSEMHDRFDRVDKELNTIYSTLQDRFDKIDVQLGKITTSLTEIQQALITLTLTLSRIERNNFEFLDALGRRPLREAINGALGYKQRTGLDMPYQPDFVGHENTFQTWGTVNAFDALSAGPTQRDFSAGQVLAELNALPLDSNLNYLNGWLSAHGLPPFANKRLANPRDWAFASRAYADLGFDWPQHLRRIDPQRQVALDGAGSELEAALQNISTISTAQGQQGNTPLFNGLISYYNAKMGAVSAGLAATESSFEREVQIQRLQRAQPFDLFGGIDQPLDYQVADVSAMSCGGTDPRAFAAPSNLKKIIHQYNRNVLADYLGLRKLTVCLSAGWIHPVQDCHRDPITREQVCTTFATPMAIITVYLDGLAIERRLAPASDENAENMAEVILDEVINRDWTSTYKPMFEAQFDAGPEQAQDRALAPIATAALESTAVDLEARLASYQRELYGRMLTELTSGGQRPASVELAGAKKLLDSFVSLGFPQAVDSDDFLRSLLFSNQRLPDDQQVIATYADALAQMQAPGTAISETALLTNPRLTLNAAAVKRRNAISGLLTRYLDGISAGSYHERSAIIADARLDMQFARILANAGVPLSTPDPTPNPSPTPIITPGQRRVVLMPVVVR